MEDSILKSTKQILSLGPDADSFDLDILTYINLAFSTLDQLGVEPYYIEDDTAKWSDLNLPQGILAQVRTYVALKVQSLWDPPTYSFVIDMKKEQLAEMEWRINSAVEMENAT